MHIPHCAFHSLFARLVSFTVIIKMMFRVRMSNGLALKALTNRWKHEKIKRRKHWTDSITSTADPEGKKWLATDGTV